MDKKQFSATLTQEDAFEFSVAFDHTTLPNLLLDEPEPLGAGRGPNAARILAAAIGHCLSASLFFCFQEARIDVTNMETKVTGTLVRNDAGRWRIGGISPSSSTSRGSVRSRCPSARPQPLASAREAAALRKRRTSQGWST